MGRRLIHYVALALLAASGVRLALARSEEPAPPAEPAAQAPAGLPAPPEAPPPAQEVPPPAGVPGEAPPAQPEPEAKPAAPAPAAAGMPESPGLPEVVTPPAGTLEKPRATPAAESPGSAEAVAPPTDRPPPGAEMPPPGPLDADVQRTQNAVLANSNTRPPLRGTDAEANPGLPGAQPRPGTAPAPSIAPTDPEQFVIPLDRLSLGRQTVGLSVEVKGPPTMNLNKEAIYKIIVSNTGSVAATDVTVRDRLPAGMEFVSSNPQEQRGPDSLFFWRLSSVAAGEEQVITLRVRPTQKGQYDHGATVTARSGARTTTRVYEPKLRVEQEIEPNSNQILKNRPVKFKISVTNTGDGDARNVIVVAKLSEGLRGDTGEGGSSEDKVFELELGEIKANQRIVLDPLLADTISGGEQSCTVRALSPDVQTGAPEAESVRVVRVVEPKLEMTLNYPKVRFTDQIAPYTIELQNTGTATARNVQVVATLPIGGRLQDQSIGGARYDASSRTLRWGSVQLEPGEKEKLTYQFQVRMGGPGVYDVSAQARAEGVPIQTKVARTDVQGIADLDMEIDQSQRVLDVNGNATFTIRIKNIGSRDATRLALSGRHTHNIKVIETAGTDAQARYSPKVPTDFAFPLIERLVKGQSIELGIRVKAVKAGTATFRLYLLHDDVDQPLEALAQIRITPAHSP